MSFGSSNIIVIKLGSYNTIVDILPYNVYILGNGSTSSNSNMSIDNYYSNENNIFFPTKFYVNDSNSEEFSLEKSDSQAVEIQDFIDKENITNWDHFKKYLHLVFSKIDEKIKDESAVSNLSVFVVSSLNGTCLNKVFSLLMDHSDVHQVRFIPIYLALLYNYPMGNYLQHQQQSVGIAGANPISQPYETSYSVSGSLGKLYQDFILNNDLSSSTTTLQAPIVNSNVTTNPILLQNIAYLSNFQTNTGFQGNSLIIDIGYKETKIYFIEHFKNLREFETTLPIGCFNILGDIKKSRENEGYDDINLLLENGWVNFQLNEALSNDINKNLNGGFVQDDDEEEEELDVAKILAAGKVEITSNGKSSNNEEQIVGKIINYGIGEFDAVTTIAKAIYKISSLQTSNKFPDVLSFSKMLENVVFAGSISRSKSFKDSLIQLLKYEFQARTETADLPNVNPFYLNIRYVHSASYFPNWKEDNSQQLAITKKSNNANTFDSEVKGALIVSRYGFDQLVSYPKSQYNSSYNYSIFDGIVTLQRNSNL